MEDKSWEYLDGRLDSKDEEAFQQSLANNPAQRQEYLKAKALDDLLSEELVRKPAHSIIAKVMDRIAHPPTFFNWKQFVLWFWIPFLGLLGITYWLNNQFYRPYLPMQEELDTWSQTLQWLKPFWPALSYLFFLALVVIVLIVFDAWIRKLLLPKRQMESKS